MFSIQKLLLLVSLTSAPGALVSMTLVFNSDSMILRHQMRVWVYDPKILWNLSLGLFDVKIDFNDYLNGVSNFKNKYTIIPIIPKFP
jgi:hypothetical protein